MNELDAIEICQGYVETQRELSVVAAWQPARPSGS